MFCLQFVGHVTRYTTYAVQFTLPITHLTLATQGTGIAMPWSHSRMWCSCVNPAFQARSMVWLPNSTFLSVRGLALTRESKLIQMKSTQTWTPRTCGRYENKTKIICLFNWVLLTCWGSVSRANLSIIVACFMWQTWLIVFNVAPSLVFYRSVSCKDHKLIITMYQFFLHNYWFLFSKRELIINLVLFDRRFTKMASSCIILMRQMRPPQAGCDS